MVDDVIIIDKKQLKKPTYLYQLRKELHSRHFDMTLDLQCIAKSAIVSLLSGAPENMATGSFVRAVILLIKH